ncbi:MAG: LLM class flavin-dependent oxidoreductase [Pseudonocardia sp.]|nr:LLM class flavin-dependent oxidoreductase [Pseudonocardia sp.]
MDFDVFCSLARTPRDGVLPDEATLLGELLDQAVLADQLGFGCLWVAEAHFSIQAQKAHDRPVMPHWDGEVGLNPDICQLAGAVFARTRRLEVGSAIMNIVGPGPLIAAERVSNFLAWHGLDLSESRRMNVGFASGRYDFVNRTYGLVPRSPAEAAAWSRIRGALLQEAAEIFVRLLQGEELSADDVAPPTLSRTAVGDPELFDALRVAPGGAVPGDEEHVAVARRWSFDRTRLVPGFRPELLQLYAGTHLPSLQAYLNRFAPVRVFNLSITKPEDIERTHERMVDVYHPAGGPWRRPYMPRTVFVFLNGDPRLTGRSQRAAAQARAEMALTSYWIAMDGTLDPARLADSSSNAVVGNPADVARQLRERFHPDDRVMLWFDFFRPSGETVLEEMTIFAEQVLPRLDRDEPVRAR